ncbi:hypothetical protein DPMN_132464 [Dreissena polymorpha]|uniref:B box-type domain-containing protein n=1 Tax=Dreissena polymorpha TaxID=45954 RepID=A0A9D4FYD3_DREPO|nr:hypothetical protein DPMN_132464 [Dreissena polymorpha]
MSEIKENESFNQQLASKMIGECVLLRQCDAYLRVNISVTAKLFCVSCTELLCTECKNGHVWYKIGKHNFVDATNAPKTPYSVDLKGLDKCEENTQKIKFFCHDHSLFCCITCAFCHRKCENSNDLAKLLEDCAPKLQNLVVKLAEAADNERDCNQASNAFKVKLRDLQKELVEMKEQMNKLFDKARELTDKEAKLAVDMESKRLGKRQ